MKKIYVFAATFFTLLSCTSIHATEAEAITPAASTTVRCEKRVKQINNRGKKLAKQSKSLQTKYKNSNSGWKKKSASNRKLVAKYKNEPDLRVQTSDLSLKVNSFQKGVFAYNQSKTSYIQERNAQIKSYKHFKANCAQHEGRLSAQNKVKALSQTDKKSLSNKSKAISQVYATQVRPAILQMRNSRNALAVAVKNLETKPAPPVQAEVSAAEDLESPVNKMGEEIDESFDQSELIDDTNIEEEIDDGTGMM